LSKEFVVINIKKTLTLPFNMFPILLGSCTIFGIKLSKEVRADLGGTHRAPLQRERPDGEYPPGVNCYQREPLAANPLLQVVLPNGFTHESKKSKGVSYKGSDSAFVKGTSRTRQQAEMACLSWAWSWWDALTPEKRSAIMDSVHEPSAKKRKMA